MKPAFARGRAKTTSQPSGVTEALDCGPNAGEVGRLGRRTLFGIAGSRCVSSPPAGPLRAQHQVRAVAALWRETNSAIGPATVAGSVATEK